MHARVPTSILRTSHSSNFVRRFFLAERCCRPWSEADAFHVDTAVSRHSCCLKKRSLTEGSPNGWGSSKLCGFRRAVSQVCFWVDLYWIKSVWSLQSSAVAHVHGGGCQSQVVQQRPWWSACGKAAWSGAKRLVSECAYGDGQWRNWSMLGMAWVDLKRNRHLTKESIKPKNKSYSLVQALT